MEQLFFLFRQFKVSLKYDALNRITSSTNEEGGVVTAEYDALGHVTRMVNEDGAVTSYTYDAWGNPLTTTGSMADTLGNLNPFRYKY